MILGVDIGGTKTLFGVFSSKGEVVSSTRIETPQKYADFLDSFKNIYESLDFEITKIVIAAPGRIDKKESIVISFGNLPWKNTSLEADIKKITSNNVSVENDAKLAALYEANRLNPKVDKVLYLTFSTGIGAGLVYKGVLDEAMLDSEAGQILLPNPDKSGELERWEQFASGKALFEKYGVKAKDLTDKKSWEEYAYKMAIGIVDLCAVIEPDTVIIGGGVGSHFKKFSNILEKKVKELLPNMVKKPTLFGAKDAEMASLLGCFEYSKLGLIK